MTFCSKEQKENEIITKVYNYNNYYTVEHLDGSVSHFYNSDEDFMKKIEDKIIQQVNERDAAERVDICINKWGSFIVGITSMCLTSTCLKNNLLSIACLGFILSMILIRNYRKNSKKLKELKKYRLLLENYKEFKGNPNISKLVEPDALYRDPVNIFTIDNFTLCDMKIMKKKLKNKEC